jgi:hypothetical protein
MQFVVLNVETGALSYVSVVNSRIVAAPRTPHFVVYADTNPHLNLPLPITNWKNLLAETSTPRPLFMETYD